MPFTDSSRNRGRSKSELPLYQMSESHYKKTGPSHDRPISTTPVPILPRTVLSWNGHGFGNVHNTVPICTKRPRWTRHVTLLLTIVIPIYSSKGSDYCCDSIIFIRAVSEINLNNCGLTHRVLMTHICTYINYTFIYIYIYIYTYTWTNEASLDSDNDLSPKWHQAIIWSEEVRCKVKLGEQI